MSVTHQLEVDTSFTRNVVQFLSWIADKGADLNTTHIVRDYVRTPFNDFLEAVLRRDEWASIPETAIEVAQLIKRLYLTSVKLKEKTILFRSLPVKLQKLSRIRDFGVEIDGNSLYRIALNHVRRSEGITESIKLVPTR